MTESQAVSPVPPPVYCPICGNKLTYHPMDATANREGRGPYAEGLIRCKNCGTTFRVLPDGSLAISLSSPRFAQIRSNAELSAKLSDICRKSKK